MTVKMVHVLFAVVLVLLKLGSYGGVQGQQPTSSTATNSPELQRLTEEVAEVKESIKELRNILLNFKDELKQEVKQTVQNEVASLNNTIASLIYKDDDEILTCNPPRITHLGFTHGHMSSTLTCISTGSPATTVTWMRDGQPLTIDGSTYFLTHTVNYGRSSTYENVLTINAAASSIYRHTYTCTVVNALGSDSKMLTATLPPKVSISPLGGTPTAGESFSLTCSVTLEDGGSLTEDLTVQWVAPVDINMDSEIQVVTGDSTGAHTSVLQFMSVRTSHGGQYTCKATTTTGTDMATATLTVQIPPPTLTVSRDPDVSVRLRHGDNLTLTCTIQPDPSPAVDSDVMVTGSLQGAGKNSTTVTNSDGVYKIMLYIPSLLATPSDTYTCTAAVEPDSGVQYIQGSESHYSLNITVELFVDVTVSYTPPPGFIPGPNEYRAASGPVIVTCTAVGGTGPVSYQWSSTCRACPFQSVTLRSFSRSLVNSDDSGIHTCTATRDSKIYGSKSINFNVVGAGLYVYNGESSGDLGSLPNNGVVISLVTARFGFYFRFFFRSDSMMRNVGMLIGPDGTTVTTGDIFKITHPRPGAMRVDNTLSQNIPTASDQGVYTCRIPLQSGEIRSINVGIYPSGFSTPPNITYLRFTHGPISSTLTCISTGSPATTVTWMRDGQPLTIDGTRYQLTQTVTNRRLSTYENVLTINTAVSNIYRHMYTCTVINVLGRNLKTVIASLLPKLTISSTGTSTAGESFSLTCSVTLEDGGPLTEDLTVQWEAPVDISMDSNIAVVTNDVSTGTRTSALQFTPVRTSHGGQYTCRATTTAGMDYITEILTMKIPPPTLAVSRDPDATVTLYLGDPLTLTCTIQLDPAVVDSGVVVTGRLGGPGGNSTTMIASAGVYRIILDVPTLQATSSVTYACTVTVEPSSRSIYVNGSESQSSIDITVVQPYLDCKNAYESGERRSGVYTIRPVLSDPPFNVYCNMESDGGGWTVFQRRQDGSRDFYLYWDDYERGFGNLTGEFWLGLSKIHALTASAARSELRVDLKGSSGRTAYAKYRDFRVGDSASNYTLSVTGYTGTAGDALSPVHSGQQFSTRDLDNDDYSNYNCAVFFRAGWWYRACYVSGSHLNGPYNVYVHWLTWRGPGTVNVIFAEMKLRST